ncbi:diaminobutyrate acetyltransferase [Rhodococcus sp. HNM0563]|uniref:diaminobutyrate acetyltransferase n=1 Tax=unclassified Rhodococcus (in: high G+C Gram-positive bacteria) TaxID=192944 RepID=UPI00146D9DBD|nr:MULTISPECIES: diaminobutyrate acetyltransferase [unclassified Rhodococcus (in: high G+C Gram-positive bacteria)]MCK0092438.1 diaminobutyrate acetyltransferase [Rhodococcus sp. F64268]NLU63185.1 diaminobutyrate acetyltransferase [Rhodococcus sp. HNM0563]
MKPVMESSTPTTEPAELSFRSPEISDGKRLWQIARDSEVLDVNSGYAYVLWCRDFADTSVVAVDETDRPVGFITGYRRQDSPQTLFVWQVAVDADQRGRGVAGRMLDALLDRLRPSGVTRLETTVSPDNAASIAMFTALARRRGTHITRTDLFAPDDFPDSHLAEDLYTIGD